jgi:hypothetical protein
MSIAILFAGSTVYCEYPSSTANSTQVGIVNQLPSDPVPTYSDPYTLKNIFKKLNPFKKKEAPPPEEEEIINVGPQQGPTAAGQVIRLASTICLNTYGTGNGMITPGILLASHNQNTLFLRRGNLHYQLPLQPFASNNATSNGIRFQNNQFIVNTTDANGVAQSLASPNVGCN